MALFNTKILNSKFLRNSMADFVCQGSITGLIQINLRFFWGGKYILLFYTGFSLHMNGTRHIAIFFSSITSEGCQGWWGE